MVESTVKLQNEIKNLLSVEQAWYYAVVPIKEEEGILHLFLDEQKNSKSWHSELEIVLGKKIVFHLEESNKIEKLLLSYYPRALQNHSNKQNEGAAHYNLNTQGSNFLENLLKEANELHSSDIHVETYGEKCRIRFRVDGILIDRHQLNRKDYPALINKVKIAAACDIAEKRLPQDGRIRMKFNNTSLDIRVSILPTLYGEKIVLRLLGSDSSHISLENLGLNPEEYARYEIAVKKPNGIILISGPTGSGKTTTLYATLKRINKPTNNILTIEDPIEYTLDGVNQVQLREDIGLGYPEALKTFLRQDPDVIMLGEIRDPQTAQMAIRAALTGHLVLSTIHTNSAWGTISRLVDMGVPPYLIASTLNLTVAQRLVRLLCKHCKKETELENEALPIFFRTSQQKTQFVPTGCPTCYYSGYKGRKAIYEVINITKELTEYIKANATEVDDYLQKKRIEKIAINALNLFQSGETSLEEIYPYLISEN
jgi:type IV pilus assembly protein PilB